MNKIEIGLLMIAAGCVGAGIGHYVATQQMFKLYGDVLSAETLYYMAEQDHMEDE